MIKTVLSKIGAFRVLYKLKPFRNNGEKSVVVFYSLITEIKNKKALLSVIFNSKIATKSG